MSRNKEINELLDFVYQTPIGLCETDLVGRLVRLNPFLTQLLFKLVDDYTGEETPNIIDVLTQYDPSLHNLQKQIVGDQKVLLSNYDISINRHGVRSIRVKCTKLSGKYFIFCIEDISLLVELEDKRRQLEKNRADISTIHALAKLAESRDDDTGSHLERVQDYCKILGECLLDDPNYLEIVDPQFVETLWQASPLHDIGKVGISDNILLKPGKLTPEEFEVIKTHTIIGAKTLEKVQEQYPENGFVNMGVLIARHHHERWDGSGYPYGLSTTTIPLAARIMAIADIYDALRVRRVYKEPFSHRKSYEIICSSSGTHLDPNLIIHFQSIARKFEAIYEEMVAGDLCQEESVSSFSFPA